jgi:hypothetical protein
MQLAVELLTKLPSADQVDVWMTSKGACDDSLIGTILPTEKANQILDFCYQL